MSTLALLLILASALTHAAWNALLKRTEDTQASAVLIVAGAAVASACLALALGEPAPPRQAWSWIAASSLVEGVYFVTLARAMSLLPLGTAYGFSRGGGQLLIWPLSVFLIGESVSLAAGIGAAILVAGLFATAHKPESGRGLAWAIACAGAIGAYPFTYKLALAHAAPPCTLFSLSLFGALPVQLVALGGGGAPRLRAALRARLPLAISVVLCAGSFLSFLFALELAGPARLSALRNTSVIFAAALGWMSGEGRERRSIAAPLLVAVGAVLVAW